MKLVAYVLGAICLVAAAIYFALPAESLPSFFPGFEPGMARIRMKHGIVAAAAGVLLFAVGWWRSRG